MKVPMADVRRLYFHWQKEHDVIINKVCESGRYISGDEVGLFATELSSYFGAQEDIVVPCANGSDALYIAYMTVGLKPGDEVIMPAFNYISSLEAASRLSLTSVLADTDKRQEYRFSINAEEDYLDSLLTGKTKAIVMVNMYGMPCDYISLRKYCNKRGLILIEDNAQGLGGYNYCDKVKMPMSLMGDIATTSFFPTKPLGCMGDGGAIITKRQDWRAISFRIAQHGQQGKYNYKAVGLNSRLDTLQAAILRLRLSKLDEIVSEYNRVARYYSKHLTSLPITLPIVSQGTLPTFYQYTILLDVDIDRDKVRKHIIRKGVASQLYYPDTLDYIDVYKPYVRCSGYLNNAHDVNKRMISLPIFPFMKEHEMKYVVDIIKEAIYVNQL